MQCASPTATIDEEYAMSLIISAGIGMVVLFIAYYIYEWFLYYQRQKKKFQGLLRSQMQTALYLRAATEEPEDDEDEIDIEDDGMTVSCCCCLKVYFEETKGEGEDALEYEPGEARRVDQDQEFTEQLTDDEDVVQLVLAHAIKCCEVQDGLDIYQVLAVRYYEQESRMIRGRKVFGRIGCYMEVIVMSPFLRTLFSCIVVGAPQTCGTSIVIWKLVAPVWVALGDGGYDEICIMEEYRWENVYSLKILSFMFSLIITLYIVIQIDKLEHSGLYEMMDKLSIRDMERIDRIVLWMLQLGQG